MVIALVETLWNAPLSKLKTLAAADGPVNPVGDGDAKTNAPGTYRPVGATCPATCAYLGNGCYAESGNVAMHQRRASADTTPALRAAAVAFVWAVRTGRLARLHVSGDFERAGKLDVAYVRGLCQLADKVNALAGRARGETIAWSYTHIPVRRSARMVRVLAAHGISVRFSDHAGPRGAVVAPFTSLPALRAKHPTVRFAKCPAQLRDTTCRDCTLCWTRPDLTMVFDPHGRGKRKATAAGLRVLQ